METLTERQQEVLDFIVQHIQQEGYPPTMREIGTRFGITWPAARGHLSALAKKGHIRLREGKSRGIELLSPYEPESKLPAGGLSIPIAGGIRAGKPLLAVEELENRLVIDRELFKEPGAFALRVKGQSMAGAGIYPGDYVIVKPLRELRTGDIAVVMLDDEATVKRISIKNGSVTLIPENPSMSPRTYPASEVEPIGRVIGVIRKL